MDESSATSTQQNPQDVVHKASPELPEIMKEPSLDPYFEKLERFELFSTNQCYYLVGGNKANTVFRVLKMDRTLIDRPQTQPTAVHPPLDPTNDAETASADNNHLPKPTLRPLSDFLSEDSQTYSQEEIRDMLDMIDDGNRMSGRPGEDAGNSGGLKPLVKAYGIVGFVRFLDCYYLTLITRRAKVGSIGGNNIYTIKNTETIPLKPAEKSPIHRDDDNADPSSVLLSMWNRGKRSVGLGLTNREIAELRYQGLYQVMDFSKHFFFSYTYDLTRSLQENFLLTSTKPFPPPPSKEMFMWNFFLTREFEACLDVMTSFYWVNPMIHGAFVQRRVHDYGRVLDITLLARRSRHFAGTRYLKRGVSEQGKVANDVEHEQIIHDDSRMPSGTFSSFIQVRGSIPTFWSQESSVTMPKPPIEVNRVDPTYTSTRLHFEDLLVRYSSPILVLDLVKQSEKRQREVRVGDEYRRAVDYINATIDDHHKIQYCACDYSHISKHRHLDVSSSLNEVSTWAVNQTGFFCSAPKWKITEEGVLKPFSKEDSNCLTNLAEQLGITVFPMEQSGVLRTNCIDCLDRTNVAQFSAGVEAISQQLVVMGIRSRSKLSPSSNIVRVLIDMYVEIGDNIALQYGGSEAHKKVTADRPELSINGPMGKHKELLTSIRRYYSNAFTDRLKQDAMNLFLGYYLPYRHTVPLWEMETDYYLHNHESKAEIGSWSSMGTYQRVYGIAWKEEENDELNSPVASLGRDKSDASPQDTFPAEVGDNEEAKNVQLVRKRLEYQNEALSLWWKHALQTNIQQRMWMPSSRRDYNTEVRPRFERMYQPETISQYDRYFSKAWSTPVRRSHALQHSESGNDEGEGGELLRAVSRIPELGDSNDTLLTKGNTLQSVAEFTNLYGYGLSFDSTLKRYSDYFAKRTNVIVESTFVGSSEREESDLAAQRKKQYEQYLSPNSDICNHFSEEKVQEFDRCLHDFNLSSDDVYGIHKLDEESHLGEIICSGNYEGLSKQHSAIEVATTIQEQFNAFDSALVNAGGPRVVETELRRRGVYATGVRDTINRGLGHFTAAEKQYSEILDFSKKECRRSDLTTEDSLKLYASEFDGASELSIADQIFLLSRIPDSISTDRLGERSKLDTDEETPSFVEKAAKLGISVARDSESKRTSIPTLYERERRHIAPDGFEQINEDLYSRTDNKYMVLNGAGVASWNGTTGITKLSHADNLLLFTSDHLNRKDTASSA